MGFLINPYSVAASGTPFVDDYSVDFDGVNDYVDCGDISAIGGIQGMTCSAWFNPSTTAGNDGIVSYWNWVPPRDGCWSILRWGTEILVFIAATATDTGGNYRITSGLGLSTSTWYHIAVVYDGTQGTNADRLKIYIDGSAVSTGGGGTILTTLLSPSTATLTIGRGTGNYFAGKVDDVSIYPSALSAGNITTIYNSGTPNDLSALSPLGWWWMGDPGGTSEYPTITDHGSGSNDGTMTNMASGDIVADTP